MDKEYWKNKENLQKQLVNVFPNKSSVKLYRHKKTNEISWEDPNRLIKNEIKESILSSLRQKEEMMSNGLFDCISNWFPPREAHPIAKELMLPMSENVGVDKRGGLYNETPLMLSVYFDSEKAVAKLIQRGAKTEAIDETGWTALHIAADYGRKASCEILLQQGANVNAKNNYGRTPLMYAASEGYVEIVKLLLLSGASTQIRDEDGETAFELATENKIVIRAQDAVQKSIERKPSEGNCAEVIRAHETGLIWGYSEMTNSETKNFPKNSKCCIIL